MEEVRRKLTEFESTMAFVAGGGLVLLILGFLLSSASAGLTPNTFLFTGVAIFDVMLIIGAGLFVIGTGAWLFVMRPWSRFDDWSEALYTGHEPHEAAHREEVEAPAAAAVEAVEAATPGEHMGAVESERKPTARAKPVEPDDLTVIEGIGPKTAAVLNKAGVRTFAQLAALSPEAIEEIVKKGGGRLVGKADTWPEQAAKLAAAPKQSQNN